MTGAPAAADNKRAGNNSDSVEIDPCTCSRRESDADQSQDNKITKHSRQCPIYVSKQKKEKQHKHSKKSKKEKKPKEKRPREPSPKVQPVLEFTGYENYYVDKKPGKHSHVRREQHALNYTVDARTLRDQPKPKRSGVRPREKKSTAGRYYQATFAKELKTDGSSGKSRSLTEDEFTAKTKEFNMHLLCDRSNDVDMWLDFVELQGKCYMRLNKLQLAERKLDILNKALRSNVGSDRLYDKYIEILEDTFPSFEVSQYLDELIDKGNLN